MTARTLTLLALTSSLLACGGSSPPPQEPAPAEPAPAPPPALSDVAPEAMPDGLTTEPALHQNPTSRWAIVTGFDWAIRLPAWYWLSDASAGGNQWSPVEALTMSEQALNQTAGLVPTFNVALRSGVEPRPAASYCEAVRLGLAQQMSQVQMMRNDPQPVGGRAGAVCVIRYVTNTAEGARHMEAINYVVEQGGSLLHVSLVAQGTAEPAAIDEAIASIRALPRSGAAEPAPAPAEAEPAAEEP